MEVVTLKLVYVTEITRNDVSGYESRARNSRGNTSLQTINYVYHIYIVSTLGCYSIVYNATVFYILILSI